MSALVVFVAVPWYQLKTGKYPHYARTWEAFPELLWKVEAVGAVAILSFFVGYWLVRDGAKLSCGSGWSVHTGRLALVVGSYAVAGAVGYGVYIRSIGGLRFALENMATRSTWDVGSEVRIGFAWYAMHLLFPAALVWYTQVVAWTRSTRKVVAYYATLAALVCSLAVLGGRWRAATPAVLTIIARHYLVKPMRLAQAMGAGLVCLLFFSGLGAVRGHSLLRSELGLPDLLRAALSSPVEFFLDDMGRANVLAVVVTSMPGRVDYLYGSTYLSFFTPLIRLVRNDYTGPSIGRFATALIAGREQAVEGTATSTAPGMIGELYANFGIVGAALGMCAFGALWKTAYSWLLRNRHSPRVVSLYSLGLFYFSFNSFVGVLSYQAWYFTVVCIPTLAAILLSADSRKRRARAVCLV